MKSERELRENVRSRAKSMLRNGFYTDGQLLQNLRDIAGDEAGERGLDLSEDELARVAADEFAIASKAHRAAIATWPKVTDCDRLDAAFTELNAMGIMARHNWTCCGNCGAAEMPAEFDRLAGVIADKPIIGYIFYHMQDTESAADGGGLRFNYGSTCPADSEPEYKAACVAIARTACDVLAKHGLKTSWNATYAQRPGVTLDWKRRAAPKDYVDCDQPDQAVRPTANDTATPPMGEQPQTLIARIVSIFTGKK